MAMAALTIDHFNPSLVYGAPYSGGLLRSEDGGATWLDAPLVGEVRTLATDPAHASIVYAGTTDGLVYRSTDGGRRWKTMEAGLQGPPITSLGVDATGNRVYAGTGAGVFEYEFSTAYLAAATRHTLSLRTYYSNFVSAEGCGDARVTANSTSAGPCETFTLYDVNGGALMDGDRVFLQAADGNFVSAESGGASACDDHCQSPVTADRMQAAAWETFTIHKLASSSSPIINGDSIALQAIAGDYVSAENGGNNGCKCDSVLHANRAVAQQWETFTVVFP